METSVYAPGTGGGTKNRTHRPNRTMRGGHLSDLDPPGLTPEEVAFIIGLPRKERKAWFEKRRKAERRKTVFPADCEKAFEAGKNLF